MSLGRWRELRLVINQFLSSSLTKSHHRAYHHLQTTLENHAHCLLLRNRATGFRECWIDRRKTSSRASFWSAMTRTQRRKCLLTSLLPIQLIQKSSLFTLNAPTRREFSERRMMGFSREEMFAVVSDVENYSEFLPWCEYSVVRYRDLSLIQADLVIGMKPVTESYTSRVMLLRPSHIIAESKKGTHFNQMVTKWKFSPGLKSNPKSCIIDFYVMLEFRSILHANLANVFFNEVVKAMAGAFYEEAKRRYGKESMPSRKIEIIPKDDDKTQF